MPIPLVVRYGGVAITVLFAVAACDRQPTAACNVSNAPSITLTIRDSATLAPAAAGATIYVRETSGGDVSLDTLNVPDTPHSLSSVQIGDSPGVFDLRVDQPGYRGWTRNGVNVPTQDDCTPETVRIEALLQRA